MLGRRQNRTSCLSRNWLHNKQLELQARGIKDELLRCAIHTAIVFSAFRDRFKGLSREEGLLSVLMAAFE